LKEEHMSQSTVPVGPTTLVGWGTALTAFAGALIAYLTGDHTAQSVTAVELAAFGLLPLLVTQLGRYAQVKKIEAVAKPVLDGIEKENPGLVAYVAAYLKSEVERIDGEDPATDAATVPAETAAPHVSDQSALSVQYARVTP
jgi:hypothetical protein